MQGIVKRRKQNAEWDASRDVPIIIGLTALFSSLLIYSAVMMGFRRFPYVMNIMDVFAPTLLVGALVASVLLFISALWDKLPSSKILSGLGGLFSIMGSALFCLFITGFVTPDFIVALFAALAGMGEAIVCCVWGRIGKKLPFEKALVLIATAFALALGVELLVSSLSEMLALGLFIVCTLAAVTFPLALSRDETASEEQGSEKKSPLRLKALQELALEPAVGVLVFAYCLGSMRALFWEAHNEYVIGSLGAVVVVVFVLVVPRKQSLTRLFSVVIIPSCAVALLAANNIVLRVGQGDFWAQSLLYLFFGLAIVLTLATLCATAHGGEISGDVLFSGMLALFAAASVAGQATAEFCPDSVIEALVAVIIALYAVAVVIMRSVSIDKAWGTFAEAPKLSEEVAGEMTGETAGEAVGEAVAGKDPASCSRVGSAGGAGASELSHKSGEESVQDRSELRAVSRQEACEALAQTCNLTGREQEILALLARGHNGVYISEVLFISPNTARTHIHNIYRKLGVSSREEILSLTNPEYQAEK